MFAASTTPRVQCCTALSIFKLVAGHMLLKERQDTIRAVAAGLEYGETSSHVSRSLKSVGRNGVREDHVIPSR